MPHATKVLNLLNPKPVTGKVLWTPAALGSALVAWWDASDTAHMTFNGSNISSWTDKINGIIASQATAGNQPGWGPTIHNGKPGLSFNGSSQYLSISNLPASIPIGTSTSLLAVAGYANTGVTGYTNLLCYGVNTSHECRGIGYNSSSPSDIYGTLGSGDISASVVWPGFDRFVEYLVTSSSQTLYVDSILSGTSNYTPATTNNILTIGCFVQISNYFNGIGQQILIFSRVLTTTEQQQLEGWESWYDGKNGSNLPYNHPYRYAPPYLPTLINPISWNPRQLGNSVVAWFDAQDLSTLTFNSSNVSAWANKAINAGTLTAVSQGTSSNQPGYSSIAANRLSGLTFNGYNFLYNASGGVGNLPYGSADSTIIVVANLNPTGNTAGALSWGYPFSISNNVERSIINENNYVSMGANSNDHLSAETWSGLTRLVINRINTNGTNSIFNIDGLPNETHTLTTLNTGTNNVIIGAFTSGYGFWYGSIQEIIVLNKSVTPTEQQLFEGYLAWKWGLV